MHGFSEAEDFPRPCDDLPVLLFQQWSRFFFVSLTPDIDFADVARQLDERLSLLDLQAFQYSAEHSRTYSINAHWALYCDNYLEVFHIPFVHQGLNKILDCGSYSTHCNGQVVLQIGYTDSDEFTFDLPVDHPDYGRHITAFYYWIFLNLMLNFYPWVLQMYMVRPISTDRTDVEFLYCLSDPNLFHRSNGAVLADQTELEDEFVVEAVQRGIRSRKYRTGRFSPTREKGVHHFHRLLAEALRG